MRARVETHLDTLCGRKHWSSIDTGVDAAPTSGVRHEIT